MSASLTNGPNDGGNQRFTLEGTLPSRKPVVSVDRLDEAICVTMGARRVSQEGVEFVRQFLKVQGFAGLVEGVDSLERSLQALGCTVSVEFAQRGQVVEGKFRPDRENPPFAILTATQGTAEGLKYCLPNINMVLDPTEFRGLNADGDPKKKYLMTAVSDEAATPCGAPAYPISLERFNHAVKLVLANCTGATTEWSEYNGAVLPFEMKPAFSEGALGEAFHHLDSAVGEAAGSWYERQRKPPYSFMLHEIVLPEIALRIHSDCSPEVGRREPLDIREANVDPMSHQAVVQTAYPLDGEMVPIAFAVRVRSNGPFADAIIEEIGGLQA
jgi:hypothetical protein